MITLQDALKSYDGGCCVCKNMVGLKEILIGYQQKRTSIILCHMCRTALVIISIIMLEQSIKTKEPHFRKILLILIIVLGGALVAFFGEGV